MNICIIVLVCKLNVHKRCEKNVANNCGINTKDMAKVLQEIGIFSDIVNPVRIRKKVKCNVYVFALEVLVFSTSW